MELGIQFSSYCRSVISSFFNSISCLVSGTVLVPLFKSISTMSGFPSRLSCPVQSVVLLFEAKANLLYCIRSSWLLGCGRPVVFLPYKNAYYIVLEASPAASKTRFIDKARSVLDLRFSTRPCL
ncbi:hypothetical protein V6N12_076362 [Hibiscus sabdariffa]|uniref:Uncharacterized protein n=1 Tax=Hibiscus sabdariffa TaxID=183260 RepID=A0ABR2D9K7_9ROSI